MCTKGDKSKSKTIYDRSAKFEDHYVVLLGTARHYDVTTFQDAPLKKGKEFILTYLCLGKFP